MVIDYLLVLKPLTSRKPQLTINITMDPTLSFTYSHTWVDSSLLNALVLCPLSKTFIHHLLPYFFIL